MKPFFNVQTLEQVMVLAAAVEPLAGEAVALDQALGRTLAAPLLAPHDLPGFDRATMDGYAVLARDTFGASESAPAFLTLAGDVRMGEAPGLELSTGQCARIGTGGMLPAGADAVVMVEHTREVEDDLVEVTRSVPPGGNMVGRADDAAEGDELLPAGAALRVQEVGLLAAVLCPADDSPGALGRFSPFRSRVVTPDALGTVEVDLAACDVIWLANAQAPGPRAVEALDELCASGAALRISRGSQTTPDV